MVCFHKFLSLTSNFVEKIIKKSSSKRRSCVFPLLKFTKQRKKWEYLKFPLNHRRQILYGAIIFFSVHKFYAIALDDSHTYVRLHRNGYELRNENEKKSSKCKAVAVHKWKHSHVIPAHMKWPGNAMQCNALENGWSCWWCCCIA